MIDAAHRFPVLILSAVLLAVSACSGGNRAPIEERSTGGAAAASAMRPPTADMEPSEGDWTATVRPLGESGATRTRELPGSEPLPAEETSTTMAPARALAPAPASPAGGAAQEVNPAVVSLLNTASAQSRSGDYARAAATLERAIAIEPGNAWLWHRLAETRLHEGRLDQAASLASKSSSLTSADRRLQADNWNLIAEVRRRQGDTAGAAAAAAQARALGN